LGAGRSFAGTGSGVAGAALRAGEHDITIRDISKITTSWIARTKHPPIAIPISPMIKRKDAASDPMFHPPHHHTRENSPALPISRVGSATGDDSHAAGSK
jgi:hypothetical protein